MIINAVLREDTQVLAIWRKFHDNQGERRERRWILGVDASSDDLPSDCVSVTF